ncbi:MAG: DUF4136 domain-containing protein [Woeseiaceae bacterium]
MKLKHFLAIAIIGLVSCASTPNTVSNVAPDADFSKYSTYGFFSPLATDEQGYESIVSSFLKVATAQELDRRGLKYAESPDLKVNFYINTEEKIRTRSVPTMQSYYGTYYGYRRRFGYDPFYSYQAYETRVDQYTEGTLNIDVVDVKAQKLVWEGMASGRVRDSAIINMEQSIDSAVAAIMQSFPR